MTEKNTTPLHGSNVNRSDIPNTYNGTLTIFMLMKQLGLKLAPLLKSNFLH